MKDGWIWRGGNRVLSGTAQQPGECAIGQSVVRSVTSVGANSCEADDAESKRDFRHKIGLCRKEARETKYWLRMIAKAAPTGKTAARALWAEAKQLHLIFAAIVRTTNRNLRTANIPAAPASGISH